MKKNAKGIRSIVAKMLITILICNVFSVIDVAGMYSVYASVFQSGSGIENDPYIITTADQLNNIRDNLAGYYNIAADIDMSSISNFEPIGTTTTPFTGQINGLGHTIKNININSSKDQVGFIGVNNGIVKNISFRKGRIKGKDHVGVIGINDGYGIIENVYSVVNVVGQNSVSGIAGTNYGIISNVYTNSNVYGNNNVGGIAGTNSGDVENTYTIADIRGKGNVASIVGSNIKYATVKNSYSDMAPLVATGEGTQTSVVQKSRTALNLETGYDNFDFTSASGWTISINPNYPYATLKTAGHTVENDTTNYKTGDGTILNPYQIATPTHLNNINKNLNSNYIINSDINMLEEAFVPIGNVNDYFTGIINGNSKILKSLKIDGGNSSNVALVSYNDGVIKDLGLVLVDIKGEKNVSAFVGYNGRGTLERVFATGNVTGNNNVAGIIGENASGTLEDAYSFVNTNGEVNVASLVGHNVEGKINRTYSIGKVTGKTNSGRLVGKNETTGSIKSSHSSHQDTIPSIGLDSATGTQATNQTDADLKLQGTYTGWDFSNVWKIESGINDGYPHIRSNPNILINKIELNKTNVTLESGQTETLTQIITPSNATVKDIKWTSDNESVATVDQNGVVKAVAEGVANISVTTVEGNHTATCKVKVGKFITDFKIVDESGNEIYGLAIDAGQTKKIKIQTEPENAEVVEYNWKESDDGIYKIISGSGTKEIEIYGEPIPESDGVSSKSEWMSIEIIGLDGNSHSKDINIAVTQRVTELNLTQENTTVEMDLRDQENPLNLTATILPNNAHNKNLRWSIEDQSIVDFVTNPGTGNVASILPKKIGTTKVVVESNDPAVRIKKEVTIKVYKYPIRLDILNNGILLGEDESVTICESINGKLTHAFDSTDITDGEVVYSVDNTNVVDLQVDGTITPKKNADRVIDGEANVTIQTISDKYTPLTRTVKIYTEQHATTIGLNRTSYTRDTMLGDEFGRIFVNRIIPNDTIKQDIEWTSSDPELAEVRNDDDDPKSVVINHKNKPGTFTITAKVKDGIHDNVSATCKVTLKRPATDIILEPDKDIAIHTVDTKATRIYASAFPEDATEKGIVWTVFAYDVSGNQVETGRIHEQSNGIDEDGRAYIDITPKEKGNLIISARSQVYMSVEKQINVEIRKKPVELSLDSTSVTLATENVTVASGEYKQSQKITATVDSEASNSYNKVGYTSLDESIATVDSQGNITAVKGGTTRVKAYSVDFEEIAIYSEITVKQVPTKVDILTEDESEIITNGQIAIYDSEKYSLKHAFEPLDITVEEEFGKLTYESSDPSKTDVDENGNVEVYTGTVDNVDITVRTINGKTAKVTIVPRQHPTEITLDKYTHQMKSDETLNLTATVNPDYAYNKNVIWTSSDKNVATVDENGVVTAHAAGTVNITAEPEDNFNSIKADCYITIGQAATSVEIIDKITENVLPDSIEVYNEERLDLVARVVPDGTLDKSVTWSTDNLDIAGVTELGVVTFKENSSGIVNITVETINGKTDVLEIMVKNHAKGIEIVEEQITIYKENTYNLNASVLPENSYNKNIIWTSQNEDIATVDENGVVKGILGGTAVIKAEAEDGNYTDTVIVNVVAFAESLTVENTELIVYVGDEPQTLKYNVLPIDTTDKTVTCSMDKADYIRVENSKENQEELLIYGEETGIVLLTLTSNSKPQYTTNCTVHVRRHPESITLDKTEIRMYTESIELVVPTILPADSYDKSVVWTSSNESVVTVDQNGKIESKELPGEAVITATTTDGNLQATCDITVIKAPESVTADMTNITVFVGHHGKVEATVLPEYTTNKNVSFDIISGEDNISISQEGNIVDIYGEKIGLAKVRAYSVVDEKKYIDIVVDVKQAAENVEIIDVDTSEVIEDIIVIYGNEIARLAARVTPNDAYDTTVIWSSADIEIATVNSNGIVRAAPGGAGNVKIRATSKANPEIFDEVEIEVRQKVTGITLPDTINIYGDEPYQIEPTILPSNAYNKDVTWQIVSLQGEKYATIDEKTGIITPTGLAGTIDVLARTVDGNKMASTQVNIINKVKEIAVDKETVDLYLGDESQTVTAKVLPEDAQNKDLHWSISNTDFATMKVISNEKIEVTPIQIGTSVVRVTSDEDINIYKEITVNVKKHVESIEIDKTQIELYTSETDTITPTILPEDATDKTAKFISSDEAIVKVDDLGNITALKAGTATIRVETNENPNIFKECQVTVKQYAESIEIMENGEILPDKIIVKSDSLHKYDAYILPEDTTDKSVTWSIDDTTKATIDEDGLMTLVPKVFEGTFTITVTTSNGISKTIQAEIRKREESIALFDSNKPDHELVDTNLYEVDSIQLIAKYMPYKDKDAQITRWWSTDETRATVSSTGEVNPVVDRNGYAKPGQVTIYAEEGSTGKTAFTTFNVKQNVIQIELVLTDEEIEAGGLVRLKVGTTRKFEVKTIPSFASNGEVSWSVSRPSVASIDEDGLLTANVAGTALLTVTSKVRPGLSQSIFIQAYYGPNSVEFVDPKLEVFTDEPLVNYFAEVFPEDSRIEYGEIVYSSDNETIATIGHNTGNLIPIKPGKAKIRASVKKELEIYKEIEIEVKKPVIDLTLSKKKIEIYTEEEEQVIAEILPADATHQDLIWSSQDESIATVTDNGIIKGISPGATKIIVKSGDRRVTKEIDVIVGQHVTGVSLNIVDLDLEQEQSWQLRPIITPHNATNKNVTWKSSDETIAKVSEDGTVTAVGTGNATITVTTVSGGFTATCNVNVTSPIKEIKFKDPIVYVSPGQARKAEISFIPTNPDDKRVKWEILEGVVNDVAMVNPTTGVIMGYDGPGYQINGEVTLRVTSIVNPDVYSDVIVKLVWPRVEEVIVNKSTLTLEAGTAEQLIAKILPTNAVVKSVNWKSADETIATVNTNGVVTGKMPGKTQIAVYSDQDPELFDVCEVTITRPTYSLSLDNTTLSMIVGDKGNLNASFDPSNITNEIIDWTIEDPTIANITELTNTRLEVEALKNGSTKVIAALRSDPKIKIEADIFVEEILIESVNVTTDTQNIPINGKANLTATILPEEVLDKRITWKSSDPDIATVDENGVVTGEMPGEVIVTATSVKDPTKSGSIKLNVLRPNYTLNLDKTNVEIEVYKESTFTVSFTPENISKEVIDWILADTEVAELIATEQTNQVKVKGLKPGTTQLYGILRSDDTKSVSAQIIIKEPELGNKFISIKDTSSYKIAIYPKQGLYDEFKYIRYIPDKMDLDDFIQENIDLGAPVSVRKYSIARGGTVREDPYEGANIATGLVIEATYSDGTKDAVFLAVNGDVTYDASVSIVDAAIQKLYIKESSATDHPIFAIALTFSDSKFYPSMVDSAKLKGYVKGTATLP